MSEIIADIKKCGNEPNRSFTLKFILLKRKFTYFYINEKSSAFCHNSYLPAFLHRSCSKLLLLLWRT